MDQDGSEEGFGVCPSGTALSSASQIEPAAQSRPSGLQSADAGHTPLPWLALDESTAHTGFYTVRSEREPIGYFTLPNAEVNTKFIVRACNSHYELLTALKALTDEAWTHMTGGAGHLIDEARAAIAKAEA